MCCYSAIHTLSFFTRPSLFSIVFPVCSGKYMQKFISLPDLITLYLSCLNSSNTYQPSNSTNKQGTITQKPQEAPATHNPTQNTTISPFFRGLSYNIHLDCRCRCIWHIRASLCRSLSNRLTFSSAGTREGRRWCSYRRAAQTESSSCTGASWRNATRPAHTPQTKEKVAKVLWRKIN